MTNDQTKHTGTILTHDYHGHGKSHQQGQHNGAANCKNMPGFSEKEQLGFVG